MISIRRTDSLDEIFKANEISAEIGILSIDIDYLTTTFGMNSRYVDPQVVVKEHNQHIAPHIEYLDLQGQVYLKCSAKALEKLGEKKITS